MTVYIAADHRGYQLKQALIAWLSLQNAYTVVDCGNTVEDPGDDYPDFAIPAAQKTKADPGSFGIVICGSGVGVSIAANKVKGVRCGLVTSVAQAVAAKKDDNCNMFALPADFVSIETAKDIVQAAFDTPFTGEERHNRRIEKISQVENLQ